MSAPESSPALSSRVAVVTGASSGIGAAIAARLAEAGAAVVINARRAKILHTLAAELAARHSARCAVVAGDAADPEVIRRLLDTARERFGREADCVVVNAGRGLAGSTMTSDMGQWEELYRTNLLGAARLMRAACVRMLGAERAGASPAPDWRARARDLVVLGSTVGRHLSPFSSFYGSSKFALHSLAEALRREVCGSGIRVTLIEPGIVRTGFQDAAGYDPAGFGAHMEKIGPVLEADDVARLIPFIVAQPAHVHVCDVVVRPTRQDYP
ncbi:MAG TPA: SDR family oxidoreductase [Phycisphaerales bacterium]|nr:SDR family oxidoreductase [Phycisphaerales bacterium]